MDEIPEEFKDGEMITQMKEKYSGEKKIETYIKGEKLVKEDSQPVINYIMFKIKKYMLQRK
jgi:hypothetical protein